MIVSKAVTSFKSTAVIIVHRSVLSTAVLHGKLHESVENSFENCNFLRSFLYIQTVIHNFHRVIHKRSIEIEPN